MKFAGIIAEYDPFHNGHAWQLAQAKALGAQHVACLLYTSFGGTLLVTAAMMVYLLNQDMDNSVRITWLVVTALMPVLGVPLFWYKMCIRDSISVIGLWSPTADLNTEAAWAIVVFVLIMYYKIKTNGILSYLKGLRWLLYTSRCV